MSPADWTALGTCVLAGGVIVGGVTFLIRKYMHWRTMRRWKDIGMAVLLSTVGANNPTIQKIMEALNEDTKPAPGS